MNVLLHPGYFPNIAHFAIMAQHSVQWEVEDNYQKQTYRNRCYICTDRGKHMLNIPIQHVGGQEGRQKYKDVRLDNQYKWQRQHWRTLQTAYRTSPFFEYYEDDLAPLFEKEYTFLLDFNFRGMEVVHHCLQLQMSVNKTSGYVMKPDGLMDGRFLVNAKKNIGLKQKEYVQVFNDRHNFIENTSILDLLFNEGTTTLTYLKNQNLDFLDA